MADNASEPHQRRVRDLEENKAVYLENKDRLVAEGKEGHWLLIVGGEIVTVAQKRKDIILPQQGNFFLVRINEELTANIY